MKKAAIIGGTCLVFSLGVLMGVLGTRIYIDRHIRQLSSQELPPRIVPKIVRHLSRELDLTPEQRAQTEEITRQMTAALFQLRRSLRPELEKIIDRHHQMIRDILDTVQQEKLDRMKEKLKKRWLSPPPPPAGPPGHRFGPDRPMEPPPPEDSTT